MTVTEALAEGLQISAAGIVLVFVALGLIVLLILGLQAVSALTLGPEHRRRSGAGGALEVEGASEADELARVASIAAALVHLQSADPGHGGDPSLGRLLEQRLDTLLGWWEAGHVRTRQRDPS